MDSQYQNRGIAEIVRHGPKLHGYPSRCQGLKRIIDVISLGDRYAYRSTSLIQCADLVGICATCAVLHTNAVWIASLLSCMQVRIDAMTSATLAVGCALIGICLTSTGLMAAATVACMLQAAAACIHLNKKWSAAFLQYRGPLVTAIR